MKKQFVSPSIKVIKADTNVICGSGDTPMESRKVNLQGLTWDKDWYGE